MERERRLSLLRRITTRATHETPRTTPSLLMDGKEKYVEKYFNKQKKMKYRKHLFEEILKAEEAQKKAQSS